MKEQYLTLDRLPEGCRAVLVRLQQGGAIRRRLQDLGLLDGTALVCCKVGPHGSPLALYFRGTLIALRREDAAHILVRRIE